MTKTLQDLIDEAIFISTEYQAVLAELTGDSEWSVDFSAPSFSLASDPSVQLTPYLLGTESEQRGSWIWAWQEMGHFPDEVVSSAVQAREFGAEHGVPELETDELLLSEGLARRLTLAAKTATGVYAHYPATAGGGVRAWLLLDGPQFQLPEPTVNRMGRVMAEALQTGTAVHHQRAVDSYARLRGAHIEWDTEACAVVTAADGALRLWFDEHQLTGVETVEPAVGQRELAQAAKAAQKHRDQLRKEAQRALQLAHREAEQQRRARAEEEARRVAETEAALQAQQEQERMEQERASSSVPEMPEHLDVQETREDFAAEQPAPARAGTDGVEQARYDDGAMPFDQDPRSDAEPGLVSTQVVAEDEELSPLRDAHYDEQVQPSSAEEQDRHEGLEGEEDLGQGHSVQDQRGTAPTAVSSMEEADTDQHEVVEPAGRAAAPGQPETAEERRSALERLRSGQPGQERALEQEHTEEIHSGSSAAQPSEAQPSDEHEGRDDWEEQHSPEAEREHRSPEAEREHEGRKKGFFSRFFGL